MTFLNFFLYLLEFLGFLIVAVFIPGLSILFWTGVKFSYSQKITLSLVLGVVLFTLLSFWLNILGWRYLILVYFLFFLIYFFKKRLYKDVFPKGKVDKLGLFLIIFGGFFQSSLLLKSGTWQKDGLVFWGVNGYDGIWHCALIEEINRGFPYQNPGFAGFPLKNYHFLSDLFLAQINFFTKIPVLDLYFRFSPLFFALLLNALVYGFAKLWSKSKKVAWWSIFFVSFCSSFGWILPIFGLGSNNWETAFWGAPTSSAFLNPPFAISLVIILGILILLVFFEQTKNKKLIPLIAVTLGVLIGFKVYGAIIMFLSLGILGLWYLIKKKNLGLILILFLAGLVSLGIYWQSNIEGGGFLIWKPWWFIRTMIEAPDRVNWVGLEIKRQNYLFKKEFSKVFLVEVFAFLIFLIGNLGFRFLGLFKLFPIYKEKKFLDRFFLLLCFFSFIPSFLFVQKVTAWNTIQFFYYFIFFFSFLAGLAIVDFLKNKGRLLRIFSILLVIIFSLPASVKTFWWYNAPVPTTILFKEEAEGLLFLKENSEKESIILTYPYGEVLWTYFSSFPVPLTYYNSTYVSFFTDRRCFLEDQNNAGNLGYPLEERLLEVKEFFKTNEVTKANEFLEKNKIDYIYLVDDQKITTEKELPLVKVFDNGKVRIFKVNKIK